jgi:hypothetical protein
VRTLVVLVVCAAALTEGQAHPGAPR